MPLDISNPEVLQYFWDAKIAPALAKGFQAIAFDNVSAVNSFQRCGAGGDAGLRRQFLATPKDPLFADAVRQWAAWMRDHLHAHGAALAINLTYSETDVPGFDAIAREADIVVDEGGFARDCMPMVADLHWRQRFLSYRAIARERALAIIDQTCKTIDQIAPDIARWTLANYLVLRGDRTYLAVTGYEVYGRVDERPEFKTDLGIAIGEPVENGTMMVRHYSKGMALVNYSSKDVAPIDLGTRRFRTEGGAVATGVFALGKLSGEILMEIP